MTDELTEALGVAPPASVQELDPEVRRRLAEQVVRARAHQQEVGDQAVATALRGVPLPVRGLVKKALGA